MMMFANPFLHGTRDYIYTSEIIYLYIISDGKYIYILSLMAPRTLHESDEPYLSTPLQPYSLAMLLNQATIYPSHGDFQ